MMTALQNNIVENNPDNRSYLRLLSNEETENLKTKKTCQNKQKGRKSEVYPFEIEDMKKIIAYYEGKNNWLHYLMFILSCNMARRVNDMLSLRWYNFFNPHTGKIRENILEIVEEKTDKLANPRINSACRAAIEKYIEKTGCLPSDNNFNEYVFLQLQGNYKGSVLSDSAFLKSLKKAAEDVGIEYNVGTHSCRKTFGKMCRVLHPNDNDSMEILRTIYNHSDTKTTGRYIGLTRQKVDSFYDDMGDFFNDYVSGNKEFQADAGSPIVSLDVNDLREIISCAYEAGRDNAEKTDAIVHIDSINAIMQIIDDLKK